MWVRYFVPEDGDDSNHPNVYQAEKINSLEDLKRSFPLSGQFHFRFLKDLDKMMVWMDVTENNSPLPVFQGGLFVKANRIQSESAPVADRRPHHKANSPTVELASSSSAPTRTVPPATQQPSEKLLNFDHHDEDFTNSSVQSSSPTPVASESLFDDNHDLLGFSSAQPSSTNASMAQKSNSNADLFGLDTLQPMSSMSSAPPLMSSGYFPQGVPRSGGSMTPMTPMGNTGLGGNIPRPMGSAPMGGTPRPMSMNQQTQYNRGQMNSGGYDPFSSLGSMQRK